ncbi:MAG TPA: hemerythrin domain-containing protein [Gammaproteobacteria bacterium]|nr:hemerythrin domain-containing protein [Gammaproteobacteria bacterium]
MHNELSRRDLVRFAATGGLVVCGSVLAGGAAAQQERERQGDSRRRVAEAGEGEGEKEVTASEDLMREHGVLRRTLIVYREAAERLRSERGRVDAAALRNGAQLFRRFGEEYHERMLEEQYIFPAVIKIEGGGDLSRLVDVLLRQHMRGREITDYILGVTHGGSIAPADAQPLATAMENLARMYEAHTAREDTVLFPAWKNALSADDYHEMGERFEEIEHRVFGEDGFKDAAQRIARVEQSLDLFDLQTFTAPAPPTAEAKA